MFLYGQERTSGNAKSGGNEDPPSARVVAPVMDRFDMRIIRSLPNQKLQKVEVRTLDM